MTKINKNARLVQVKKDTYEKLTRLGGKQDTYDSIISRLLEKSTLNEVQKTR